ncbi:MAG: HhH-GPD-type base excision DNA repair protein [Acidimicrobiales bacterium]
MAKTAVLPITGDPKADSLLVRDPLALLIGMLLDQQVTMEWAFAAPAKLAERLGGKLNAKKIAAMSPDELEAVFREKPALHRYPNTMAKRTQLLCQMLVDNYGGKADNIWTKATTGDDLLDRLQALPGFGNEKARIFLALLAKRMGVRPPGWEAASIPFSDKKHRSVADVDSPESLLQVRAFKKAMKAAGKGKDG